MILNKQKNIKLLLYVCFFEQLSLSLKIIFTSVNCSIFAMLRSIMINTLSCMGLGMPNLKFPFRYLGIPTHHREILVIKTENKLKIDFKGHLAFGKEHLL